MTAILTGHDGPVSARVDHPAQNAVAVTPSDVTVVGFRSLYVGGLGNVAVEMLNGDGTAVTFTAVPVGSVLPIAVRKVLLTGTTATAIVGLI